jgi:hypothetical protein
MTVDTASIEQLETARWLQTRLGGDSTLTAAAPSGVWTHPAPDKRQSVWVTYQLQADHDEKTASQVTIWNSSLWLVRAWKETRDYEDLTAAAARIHALLNTVQAPLPGTAHAIIYNCNREQGWMQAEVDNSREFRSLGGLYRIYTQLQDTAAPFVDGNPPGSDIIDGGLDP